MKILSKIRTKTPADRLRYHRAGLVEGWRRIRPAQPGLWDQCEGSDERVFGCARHDSHRYGPR